MNSGHRHEFVSRRTIATVDMHWHASRKKIINETPVSGVQISVPSARLALRKVSTSEADFSSDLSHHLIMSIARFLSHFTQMIL